jgi:3-hydroxybutyrate dehydrogenase
VLEGRRAVVTGSTSGIGAAIARALAAEGCRVMLHGLGEREAIERQRAELAATFGTEALYNGADLERGDACVELIEDAVARLGGVDILVNNAGTQFVAPMESFPAEKWDSILAVNLSAAFHTTRTALPGMRTRGWGRIVNMASVHGLVGSVQKAAYVASKHGLVGLTKVVALETAGSGITCNAVCPGWVRTAMVERQAAARAEAEGIALEEAERGLLLEKQPSGAFTTPEQVAALTVFLCSEAAANVTGACWPIDGAWTAQ